MDFLQSTKNRVIEHFPLGKDVWIELPLIQMFIINWTLGTSIPKDSIKIILNAQ